MKNKINWHRLLGLIFMDFFTDSLYEVELEKELSVKKQYLDILILRRKTEGQLSAQLPVGLENLKTHNLLTYKSLREPMDEWAIEELVGHYCNYRKLVSSPSGTLLPADQFQLYAISTRYPKSLLNQEAHYQQLQPGVFELIAVKRKIRLIVLSQVEIEERNALWLLFSGKKEGFSYGDQHYHWRDIREQPLLNQLYELYQREGVGMPYTMKDFDRDYTSEHLHLLTPEERLKGLPTEERLRGLPPEERLKGLPPEERLRGLSTEERLKGLVLEDLVKGLSPEIIEALSKLKQKD